MTDNTSDDLKRLLKTAKTNGENLGHQTLASTVRHGREIKRDEFKKTQKEMHAQLATQVELAADIQQRILAHWPEYQAWCRWAGVDPDRKIWREGKHG